MAWIEANGVALRYDLQGPEPAAALTIALVHELAGSIESWDGLLPWLGGANVLRYDCRGAGLSEKIRGTASLDDAADDLHGLLPALDLRAPLAVIGSALGASIAIRFATRHKGRAGALALLAPSTSTVAAARTQLLERAALIESEGLRGATSRESAEHILQTVMPPDLKGDAAVMRSARARYWHSDPLSYGAYFRLLADLNVEDELAEIDQPCLVVSGLHDQVRPPARVRAIADALPHAEYATVESGHLMAWQHPQLVGPLIRDFLRKTFAPGTSGGGQGSAANG